MKTQQLKNAVLQSAFRGELLNIEVKLDAKRLPFPSNKNDLYNTSSDPLTIPSHWKWIKIEDAFEVARGGSPRPIKSFITNDANGINWIKIGDTLKGGKYITATKEKIIPEGVKKSRFVKKGDFILSNSMSFGRPYILDIDGCIHDGWLVLSQKKECYNKDFLYYLLSSPLVHNQFLDKVSGAVVNNLNALKVKSVWIPYLSLDEQIKIVEKIESLFEQIELYNQKKIHLDDLQQNFPRKIEKSIIQYAIQGKLVKQDTSDEPASELLKRILEQKDRMVKEKLIKKEKPLPPITEEEIPFDIPDTWEWARLGNLVLRNIGGGTPSKSIPEYWNGSIPWASVKDLKSNIIDSTQDTITELGLEKSSSNLIEKGNLIVCTRMGLGKIAINQMPIAINQDLRALYLPDQLEKEYVIYYFNTLTLTGKGATVKGINLTELNSLLIPVPPLNEQRRIVSKIKKMFLQTEKILSL